MNELQAKHKVKHMGVSHFSVRETREAMDASKTPSLTDQIHYDPFRDPSGLLEFCIQNNIMLTAYSPWLKAGRQKNSTLREIGEKYNKSGSQAAPPAG